jgi:hypothetical protein
MKLLLLAAQLLFAAPTPAAEVPVSTMPSKAAAELLRWTPPPGWTASEYSNAGGADPVVAYENGLDRIEIKIFGAPKSFYADPEAFMAGPGATTMGRPPVKSGVARAAGAAVTVYRRKFPLPDGTDPHAPSPGPARMGQETFCVLPPFPDGRFAVLSYARESEAPDIKRRGEKAWSAFLAAVRLARKP